MFDLPAKDYLETYRIRLKCMEDGITSPKKEIVAAVRQMVAALETMHPQTKIKLEISTGKAVFTNATTGEMIAEFNDVRIVTEN